MEYVVNTHQVQWNISPMKHAQENLIKHFLTSSGKVEIISHYFKHYICEISFNS